MTRNKTHKNNSHYCFFFFFCQKSLQKSKGCMEGKVESWNDAKTRTEQVICIFEKKKKKARCHRIPCDCSVLHTTLSFCTRHTPYHVLSLSLLHTIWSFCTRPYHCPPKFKCLKPRVANVSLTSRWMTSEIHHASRQKKKKKKKKRSLPKLLQNTLQFAASKFKLWKPRAGKNILNLTVNDPKINHA